MPHSVPPQPNHDSATQGSSAQVTYGQVSYGQVSSGKTARDENFPVGSWLIEARLRPHVMAYYRFARAADDIADSPDLKPADKIALLSRFEERLADDSDRERDVVSTMRDSLAATQIIPARCQELLYAFMQDARKSRRESWDDLLDYCRLSAHPVGRYLLDLHGEAPAGYRASDALCAALQVLNHLQDCGKDYRELDRVYLPLDWMTAEGLTVEVLQADQTPPPLRRVIDRCLDGVEGLLQEASVLPAQLKNRGLAMESAVILRLARRLSVRLRREDPLAAPVKLSKLDFLGCGLRGICAGWMRRSKPGKEPSVKAAERHG